MAAPMRQTMIFIRFQRLNECLTKSAHDWKGQNVKPTVLYKGDSKVSSYRQMLAARCKQADRTIYVQYTNKNNLSDVLSSVQHHYGDIKSGFSFPDQGGKNFVIVELNQDGKFRGPAAEHMINFSNLQKGRKMVNVRETVIEHSPKSFDLNTLSSCENISDQIMSLYKEIQIPEAMIRLHFFVGMLIRKTIKKKFYQAETMFFGSSACGVAMAGKSDLDMVVFLDISHENKLLGQLAGLLKRENSLFSDVFHIPGARVPIVKFNQIQTHMSCDISCNTLTGVLMAETLYTLHQYEPLFYPLVMAVKLWAREHLLSASGQHRLFTNHMLTMLVLAYLQQQHLLPPLKALYANTDAAKRSLSAHALFKRILIKVPPKNVRKLFEEKEHDLGELLLGFFKFYQDFSFADYVIDLHFGKVVQMPHRFHMCVMNPHEDGHNMCQNVEEIQVDRFKRFCKDSAHILELNRKKSTNGEPWGLMPVLSLQTFKKKKGKKRFDFDLVYKPDSVDIEEIIVTADGEEDSDISYDKFGDKISGSQNQTDSNKNVYCSLSVIEKFGENTNDTRSNVENTSHEKCEDQISELGLKDQNRIDYSSITVNQNRKEEITVKNETTKSGTPCDILKRAYAGVNKTDFSNNTLISEKKTGKRKKSKKQST